MFICFSPVTKNGSKSRTHCCRWNEHRQAGTWPWDPFWKPNWMYIVFPGPLPLLCRFRRGTSHLRLPTQRNVAAHVMLSVLPVLLQQYPGCSLQRISHCFKGRSDCVGWDLMASHSVEVGGVWRIPSHMTQISGCRETKYRSKANKAISKHRFLDWFMWWKLFVFKPRVSS